MAKDPYYDRPEVSNSDLSWLRGQFSNSTFRGDQQKAYRFGTLIDCMITEKKKVDYYKRTCAGEVFSADEFEIAGEMKKAFYRDPLCRMMAEHSQTQKVGSGRVAFNCRGFEFALYCRWKWDLFCGLHTVNGDIKSTTATTQKQFEEAVRYFQYHRQRAFYMNGEGTSRDMLIGISKKNFKVFKVPIERGSSIFREGEELATEWAFKWYQLFENF